MYECVFQRRVSLCATRLFMARFVLRPRFFFNCMSCWCVKSLLFVCYFCAYSGLLSCTMARLPLFYAILIHVFRCCYLFVVAVLIEV